MKDNEKKVSIKEKLEEKKLKLEPITEEPNGLKTSREKKSIDDEDISLNPNAIVNNIKKDLLFFKEEILKDLKREQIKLFEKVDDTGKYALEKIEEFNIKIQNYGEQIVHFSNMIITDKTIKEKVESLMEYKDKSKEMLTINKIKIDNLEKDLFNNVFRIDNILKETVIYPGVIGSICKFKTFHDFMDYVLKECSLNITFREQASKDINNLRNNDEKIINSLNSKLEKNKKALNLYVDTWIQKLENKVNDLNIAFTDKITAFRVENMTYLENMKNVSESLLKQVNYVVQAKDDIFNKFDEKMNIINKENSRMRKYFNGYKNEFNEMRKMFKEMMDIITSKDFSSKNKKVKGISRRQTMMNNDIKEIENKIINDKNNKITHKVSMNDIFINERKNMKNNFSVRKSCMPMEKEKNNPYKLFLQEYKKFDRENKRISKVFEKEILSEKKKKNDNLNLINKEKKKKKKHQKKVKYLNEIQLLYNGPNNIEFIKRRLNKFNTVCVPNKRISSNLLQEVPFNYVKIGNSKQKNISNLKDNMIKGAKFININSELIYDTSLSKSQLSLFSDSSSDSEKPEEKEKNIKMKLKTNLPVKEVKETDSDLSKSKFLKDEEKSVGKFKIDLDKKDFQESKEYEQMINTTLPKNNIIHGNKRRNNELEPNILNYESKTINVEQNRFKLNERLREKPNSLNKIFISIEGTNPLEIDLNSRKYYNQNEKNVISNLKTLINNNPGRAPSGYPKIVTNNGERIIYSSRPVYKKNKFNIYTNPNVIALNYNIQTIYENNKKQRKARKSNMELSPDDIILNKDLLFSTRNLFDNNFGKSKKVSFSVIKNLNFQNNINSSLKYK